jgi:hypothetical protein
MYFYSCEVTLSEIAFCFIWIHPVEISPIHSKHMYNGFFWTRDSPTNNPQRQNTPDSVLESQHQHERADIVVGAESVWREGLINIYISLPTSHRIYVVESSIWSLNEKSP